MSQVAVKRVKTPKFKQKRAKDMSTATAIVRHDVKDFAAWKSVFDAAAPFRQEGGELNAQVYRNGNTVHVLAEYSSREQAESYFANPALREKMGEAGVIGVPDISFVDKV